MTFTNILLVILAFINIILATLLIKASLYRQYVNKILKKIGRDQTEQHQVFFDKENVAQILKKFHISGRTTVMFLNAKNYFLRLSPFSVKLYYSFPGTDIALMPYEELSTKQLVYLIENASVK